ncbi:MAG: AMP-binding protein [Prolixibacteraceae bacterium]
MSKYTIHINGKILHEKDIQQGLISENLSNWEQNIYKFISNWFDESDFILQQTSGSTGMPKEIRLKKSAMSTSALKTINFFNLKENDVVWLCLPIQYIAGKMMVVRAIVGQLNLLLTQPEGKPQLPDQHIEFTAMVPLQLQKLIEAGSNFESIQKLIVGGAAVDSNLIRKIQQLPTAVYATYGMTETCSHIALQKLNGPIADKQFKLLDGISISKNSKNCLMIKAPELLSESIETTDVVEIISDREFRIIGRVDHIINSGGLKISPENLENEISKIINRTCLILPENDDILGQRVVLVLEKSSGKTWSEKNLDQIKQAVGKHRTPKRVYFIDEFPLNQSMKIDRNKVLKQLNINL